jgi:phenylpyruvate tautomerase PptA (4-oxalocrotonate tautomerase family)
MPRIIIKTLPLDNHINIQQVMKKLGKQLETKFSLLPGQFVILWQTIKPDHFLYNGTFAKKQPTDTHHPIIDITAVEGISENLKQGLIQSIAQVLSKELNIVFSNICVTINILKSGDLFVLGEFKETVGEDKSDQPMPKELS